MDNFPQSSPLEPDFAGEITGTLTRVIWHGNGFLIGLMDAPQVAHVAISVKGNMIAPQVGMQYCLTGAVKKDKKYGPAFVFDSYAAVYPTDKNAVRLYLQENCKWVGSTIADRLVSRFGESVLDICREEPWRVAEEIKGITKQRADEISEMLLDNLKYEQVQIHLKKLFQGIGLPLRTANNLIKKYDTEAFEVVKENPYFLTEFGGIGFNRADQVAKRLDFAVDSPFRIQAGIAHVVAESAKSGHTFLPVEEAEANAIDLLAVEEKLISEQIFKMVGDCVLESGLDSGGSWIADYKLHEKEKEIADSILALMEEPAKMTQVKMPDENSGLTGDQSEALKRATESNVFILTGAPGVGKTYTIKRIMEALLGIRFELAAPTGKAASRLAEMTGRKAKTIHRLLEPLVLKSENGKPLFNFTKNRINQIDAGGVIVDEASMLDVSLACSLIRAIAKGTRLIFVGDVYQLPSVGPGSVLRNLIAAGVPSVELTEIKRQDAGNIVKNCHKIKNGDTITIDNSAGSDFFFVEENDTESIKNQIVGILKSDRLVKAFGADPVKECQVLSPLRERGDLSCKVLNELLQSELNSGSFRNDQKFWIGDKVIQLKNDYDTGIINGDIGYVSSFEPGEKMIVEFENPQRFITLSQKKNDLQLAYVTTVHKYQGSEAKVIIMPVHKCLSSPIFQRNLIYTAISRAQKCCILIGQPEMMHKAVKKNDVLRRYTRLQDMLENAAF